MADERLQQLRRAWDRSDLSTQVRLLRERMRSGELAEERARLAALLDDPRAAQLFGYEPRGGGLVELAATLIQVGGREVNVRVAVAFAHALLPDWRRTRPDRDEPERALQAAEAWIARPTQANALEAERLSDPVMGVASDPATRCATSLAAGRAAWAAGYAASPRGEQLWGKEQKNKEAQYGANMWLQSHSGEQGTDVLRDELVPWTLGLRDPVAERVAAREAGE